MDPTALNLAVNKLISATHACERLQNADNFEDAEFAWSAFVLAASTVYSKLEKGAKSNGTSLGWFGRKKHERKKDDLLRYLHYARNSDEHGIEFGTYRSIPLIGGSNEPFFPRPEQAFGKTIPLKFHTFDPLTHQKTSGPINGTVEGPNIVLSTVTDDRFHDKCDPPTHHLGNVIVKPTPQAIASLGLAYLNQMIEEARLLPSASVKP